MAIDSRSWLVHRRELGAAYRTELARELGRLGFEVQRGTGRGGRYFELAGVPQELLDRWSSRHHQVQAAIAGRLEHKRQELEQVISDGGADVEAAQEALVALEQTARLSPAEDRFLALSRPPGEVRGHESRSGPCAGAPWRRRWDSQAGVWSGCANAASRSRRPWRRRRWSGR